MDRVIHSKNDYTVGYICTRPIELAAATLILDEEHHGLDQDSEDYNAYRLGKIQEHNVAIACLPSGTHGSAATTTIATDMLRTFKSIRVFLLVGIGGGVPTSENDMRLGDIVVSIPQGTSPGVIQFDMGTALHGRFERTGSLNNPPRALLSAVSALRAEECMQDPKYSLYLAAIINKNERTKSRFSRPEHDVLYKSSYQHASSSRNCNHCDPSQMIPRNHQPGPKIHYGTIASGNRIVEDPSVRDTLGRELQASCFESEAAGLMSNFPCLVIRGISNYSDSHSNEVWQGYAAGSAAAYAKELLSHVVPSTVLGETPVANLLVQELRDISTAIKVVDSAQTQRKESKEILECLRAFKTSPYSERKNINPPRVEGTCRWVLTQDKYISWRNGDQPLLLISADPGCGKSVLARHLVDHELQSARFICYFFFKDNEEQSGLCTALCALLHQIFSYRRSLLRHAIGSWRTDGPTILTERETLWQMLMRVTADPEAGGITVVFDALDECRSQDRQYLIEQLKAFKENSINGSRVAILVTSRPYLDIKLAVINMDPDIWIPGEEYNDEIGAEINLVLDFRLNQLAQSRNLPADIHQALRKRLQVIPNRTYLWLHLVLDEAEHRGATMAPTAYLESLNELPQTVDEAYERILQRNMYPRQKNLTELVLRIIVGANRPLSVGEMEIALRAADQGYCKPILEPNPHFKDQIRNLCGLFIFFNDSRIYLIHQTAKEFLLQAPISLDVQKWTWKGSVSELECHHVMARICMDYVLNNEYLYDAQRNDPASTFFLYACLNWLHHYREVETDINEDDYIFHMAFRLYSFSEPEVTTLRRWLYRLPQIVHSETGEFKVLIAAFCGHSIILKSLLKSWKYFHNFGGLEKREALDIASRAGHIKIVKHLIDRGVHIEGKATWTPLAIAARNGHHEIVEFLLANGAAIEGKLWRTPLRGAAETGNFAIIETLLDKGAEIEGKGESTPLIEAAGNGHLAIVQLLIDRGANIQGTRQYVPLYAASARGHLGIVRLLLDRGADIEGNQRRTPLFVAAESGHLPVVQYLVNNGAGIEGDRQDSPLMAAVNSGNFATVQFLLDNGANIEGNGTQTPLYTCCAEASEAQSAQTPLSIMQLLVEKGANIEGAGRWTPLCAASYYGHLSMVELLVGKGANIERKGAGELLGFDAQTPLHWANKQGHEQVVSFLLQHGAKEVTNE